MSALSRKWETGSELQLHGSRIPSDYVIQPHPRNARVDMSVDHFQSRACQLALGVVDLDQRRLPVTEQITPRARPLGG